MSAEPELLIAPDPSALAALAAETFAALAFEAVQAHGVFRVALSGGNTPRMLYERLTLPPFLRAVEWSRSQIFFSDERFVPPESGESNYHTAEEALFSKSLIPPQVIHRVPTVGLSPEEAAAEYQDEIERVIGSGMGQVPRFDLILLGLGPDGHTASLFPGTKALTVRNRLVAANYVPNLDTWRITFTYPLINAAAAVAFLVEGGQKSERVEQVLKRIGDLPAAGVRPVNGRVMWLLDTAAASRTLT